MIRPVFRRGVKLGDCGGKRRHQFSLQAPSRREPVEQGLLLEAVHLDDPVDRRVRATERE